MLEILLIRHGQTDWNRDRRIMGDQPIGLNSVGVTQMKQLARLLSPLKVEALHSSPLKRTMESALLLDEN